jgi:hypothetical protein
MMGNRTTFQVSDGTIEALKWLAVVLMLVDHINKFMFGGKVEWMFAAGRIVMPIFAFVLAYNLARPNGLAQQRFKRTAKRLLIFGTIATVPYMALHGYIKNGWPLNIMFTLLTATLVLWIYETENKKAKLWLLPTFAFGSMLCEFWFVGTFTTIAAYLYCKRSRSSHLWLWIASVGALSIININFYSLLAVPLILLASRTDFKVPRFQHFFYAFYPAHLALLWLWKTLA